jgi:hypothetical protein
MSAEAYLEKLELENSTAAAGVQELQRHWCQSFKGCEFMPPDKRFAWWLRTYGLRLMKIAVTITATNAARSWSVNRLGKYTSAVARNIYEQAQREEQAA